MSNKRLNYDFYQQLDNHGYTQNIRNRYKYHALFYESGWQVWPMGQHVIQNYKFGSFVEATMLPGRKSDMDMVTMTRVIVAFDRKNYYKLHEDGSIPKFYYEMIYDPWTAPGHAKLVSYNNLNYADEFVSAKQDICGRRVLCYKRNIYDKEYRNIYKSFSTGPYHIERSGPAMTLVSPKMKRLDFIFALSCGNWPSCANAWLHRRKTCIWLGQEEMHRFSRMRCFLVPAGYHVSNLEWRISFSLQERELLWKLSDMQYKCFILMKYIKEVCFRNEQKTFENSLTSYHCKTALFYVVENSQDTWTNENLIERTSDCFRLLLNWAVVKYCPSYFVPTVNLFSKLNERELENMKGLLESIVANPVEHIRKGVKLMTNLHDSEIRNDPYIQPRFCIYKKPFPCIKFLESLDHTHRELGSILGWAFDYVSYLSLQEAISYLTQLLSVTHKDVNPLSNIVFPFVHTTLACHLVIRAADIPDRFDRDYLLLVSAFHFWKGLESDTMSSILKLATVLIYTGHIRSAAEQLEKLSCLDTRLLFFGCSCIYSSRFRFERNSHFTELNNLTNHSSKDLECLSTDVLIQRFLCHCVMFLPLEIKLAPYPLRFEMFRSYGVPDDAKVTHIQGYWWFRCAVVDSETYLHFLRHLVDPTWMQSGQVSKGLLENTTVNTWQHYHTETKLNVAGWLTESSGRYIKALDMYLSSWRLLQDLQWRYPALPENNSSMYLHNAAKWHIVLVLYRLWCEKNQRQN